MAPEPIGGQMHLAKRIVIGAASTLALMAGGVGAANAAVSHPTPPPTINPTPTFPTGFPTPTITPTPTPTQLPNCGVIRPHPRPTLSGRNCLVLTYQGNTFYYPVNLGQFGGFLYGSITDNYLPGTLPIEGLTLPNRAVILDTNYPTGDPQGSRAFVGTILGGHLSGVWDETGPENGSGTWYLLNPV